ncbi:MAG TPA: translesion DNA synthesis-associated protein ImuA [Pusillimonas sp.]|uniref:translesion DNA synthesis-associated protein ImuA n=1 Tax=unclassified Pusillimonas TaxID=2640016 RepID=UPI002615C6B8|nr:MULTISPECIES: translesion DNA synthesis-associated protein ImuA [unclassified Pusillimonas]HLU18756.1 translesion DNA synthesis-associated protein ImuA [Pusillimonas sp.]
MKHTSPLLLRHPERIHPALWKGSQLAQAQRLTLSTGYAQLDRELPGGGWPIGSLIELTLERAGIGEIALLQPALARLDSKRRIMFIQPPHVPHLHCWSAWKLPPQPLWIHTASLRDTLWACEQTLRHNACSALLCWASGAHPQELRRLHVAARQSDTLFIMLRSSVESRQPCAAPLRLGLRSASHGLQVQVLKRRGPVCEQAIPIALYPQRAYSGAGSKHVSLDQPSSALSQSGRRLSAVEH